MKYTRNAIILLCLSLMTSVRGQQIGERTQSNLGQIAITLGESNWLIFKQNIQVEGKNLFNEARQYFGLSADDSMRVVSVVSDDMGYIHYRYQQTYKGIDVENAVYCVHEYNGMIVSANGKIVSGLSLSEVPLITDSKLLEMADIQMASNKMDLKNISLVFTLRNDESKNSFKNYILSYKISTEDETLYYDAETGDLIKCYMNVFNSDNCYNGTVNSLYNGTRTIKTKKSMLQYFLIDECRGNGIGTTYENNYLKTYDNNWNNDIRFVSAATGHWAAEMTFDYFLQKHNRVSYDGNSSSFYVNIGYPGNQNNACWNVMGISCGKGNGSDTGYFISLDVIGHEFTHGIINSTSELPNYGEAGALGESFADIFGTMVEYYTEGDNGDYLIAEDVIPSHCGLRNMENPNLKNQPDTYQGDLWYTGDNESVRIHTNSGVQNYWFYLLAEGGEGVNDNGDPYQVQGIGKEKAARIAYRNMVYYMNSSCGYSDARNGSILAAADIFGYNSEEVRATIDAWNAVGVNTPGSIQYNYETLPCDSYEYVHGTQELPIYVGAINRLTSKCNYVANGVPVTLFAGNEVRLVDGFYSGNNFTAAVLPLFLDDGTDLLMEDAAPRMDESAEGTAPSEPLRESVLAKSSTSKVTIYPNPAEGLVTVQSDSPIAQISIYDIHGRCVCNKKMRGDEVRQVETDTAVLTSGIYLVKVDYAGGGWATDRLVIK